MKSKLLKTIEFSFIDAETLFETVTVLDIHQVGKDCLKLQINRRPKKNTFGIKDRFEFSLPIAAARDLGELLSEVSRTQITSLSRDILRDDAADCGGESHRVEVRWIDSSEDGAFGARLGILFGSNAIDDEKLFTTDAVEQLIEFLINL